MIYRLNHFRETLPLTVKAQFHWRALLARSSQVLTDSHLLCILVLCLGAFLRIALYLKGRSLWLDEAMLALNIVPRTAVGLLHRLDYNQEAPIGFLQVEKLFVNLVGPSEFGLRLWPLAAALVSLYVFYHLAKRTLQHWDCLLACSLFALVPVNLTYANEAKQYSTDVLFFLVVMLQAIQILKAQTIDRRLFIWLAVSGAAGVWFSHPAALVLAGCGSTLFYGFLSHNRRREIPVLLMTIAVWVASFAPVYFLFLSRTMANDRMQVYWKTAFISLSHLDLLLNCFSTAGGFHETLLVAFLAIIGFVYLLRSRPLEALLLVSPVAVTVVASLLHKYPFYGRLILFLVPGYLLLIAAGTGFLLRSISATGGRRTQLAVTCALVALLGYSVLHPYVSGRPDVMREENIKPILTRIADQLRADDILTVNAATIPAFNYYLKHDSSRRPELLQHRIVRAEEGAGNIAHTARWVKQVSGNRRVWFIFSRVYTFTKLNDKELLIQYLEYRGATPLAKVEAPGATALLYDLSALQAE